MEDLIRLSVEGGGAQSIPSFRHSGRSDKTQCRGGGGTRASLRSDTVEDLIRISVEGGGTRASLRSDTVEDLIRISVEGASLEDVDARESGPAGLKAKDQEGQTTGVGHSRGM